MQRQREQRKPGSEGWVEDVVSSDWSRCFDARVSPARRKQALSAQVLRGVGPMQTNPYRDIWWLIHAAQASSEK
jgi:hypothetical protein